MKYSLYKVDFFELIISKVSDLKVCDVCVRAQVSLLDILSQIHKDNSDLDLSDIFQVDVDKFIKVIKDQSQYMNATGHLTLKFLNDNKIISAFGVDSDERDNYIVTVHEDTNTLCNYY